LADGNRFFRYILYQLSLSLFLPLGTAPCWKDATGSEGWCKVGGWSTLLKKDEMIFVKKAVTTMVAPTD